MSYENKFVLSLFIGGYKEIKNKNPHNNTAVRFIL